MPNKLRIFEKGNNLLTGRLCRIAISFALRTSHFMLHVLNIKSLQQLPHAANELLRTLPNAKKFALVGEMGVGKTTFVKAVCKQLGVKDVVGSPTYAIANEYAGAENTVYHLDLYRLKNLEEALQIGIEEYLYDNNAYCFIEWPQIIASLLSDVEAVKLTLTQSGDGSRQLEFENTIV